MSGGHGQSGSIRRAAGVFVAVVAVMGSTTACSSTGGTAGQPVGSSSGTTASGTTASVPASPTAEPGSATLSTALGTVPAGSTTVEFSDEVAKMQRWNLTHPLDVSDDEAMHTYITESSKVPAAGSSMAANAMTMVEEYGWSWFDVDWAVTVNDQGAPPVSIHQLRDDLDMTVVVDSMDEHYTRSGPDDRPVYTLDLAKSAGAPPFIGGAVVLPDRHLVVSGTSPDAVLATIDGSSPALTDDPAVAALAADLGAPEFLSLQLGASACSDPAAAIVGSGMTPEQLKELLESELMQELATPTAIAVAVYDSTTGAVIAAYPDADTAAAERPRRTVLLEDGSSLVTKQPYTELLGTPTIAASGNLLRYDFTDLDPAGRLYQVVMTRDAPWSFC